MMDAIKNIYKNMSGLLLGLIIMVILLGIFVDGFASLYNLQNIAKDFSILLVVSIAMTLAILLGKIDISVGSVMSMSGIIATVLLMNGYNIIFALIVAMLSGVCIGLINGYLIGYHKFDYFIVTFATLAIAKSIAFVVCNGKIIPVSNSAFMFIGSGKIAGIYFVIWLSLIIYLLMYYITNKTEFGYKIYSIGGSEQTSILAGINPQRVYIKAFAIGGLLASISGIFLAAVANTGNATAGTGYEFNAIAAVLIGGTPFDGGRGGLKGTFVGALFITVLKNGLNLMGFTPSWQYTIIGFIILTVLIVDVIMEEQKKKEVMRRKWYEY